MTTQATKAFVEELIQMFDLSSGHPFMRESMAVDLTARGPEQVAGEFGRVEALLRGLEYTAEESLGLGASLVFGEARQIAEYARSACEQHA